MQSNCRREGFGIETQFNRFAGSPEPSQPWILFRRHSVQESGNDLIQIGCWRAHFNGLGCMDKCGVRESVLHVRRVAGIFLPYCNASAGFRVELDSAHCRFRLGIHKLAGRELANANIVMRCRPVIARLQCRIVVRDRFAVILLRLERFPLHALKIGLGNSCSAES